MIAFGIPKYAEIKKVAKMDDPDMEIVLEVIDSFLAEDDDNEPEPEEEEG